ncbi:DUF6114 domain-containing protein [Streptomyces sp. XM4193]|uniref:DUF6114 domain-containing protein n=1 Tax=Streptomyces sp. XM4193 TaxID=2929782 RepID=UPI001FF7398D|nr:DUF6114 domain-containing protein [Streptomyces sp. XM4193]MCK1797543.1 DUF6114 domain-containing protein [Streptomyces sp. XM4193]
MSAESPAARERLARWRVSFRHWRWQRPFWAGLLTLLASVPIVYIPYADPSFSDFSLRLATTTGSGSLIIGVLLMVLGLTFWYQRHARVFAGVAAILLGLVSLVVSNFGGFLAGFLLAMIGGAMGIAWVSGEDQEAPANKHRRGGGEPTGSASDSGGPEDSGTSAESDEPAEKADSRAEAGQLDGGSRAG